jgi:hypothetical protein
MLLKKSRSHYTLSIISHISLALGMDEELSFPLVISHMKVKGIIGSLWEI